MLTLITAAVDKPVSLEEAIAHCRLADVEGSLVEPYLDAATSFVADRVGITLAPVIYRIDRSDWWGGCLEILVAPVRDIESLKYLDESAVLQTVDSALYRWHRTDLGARLELLSAFTSPAVQADQLNAVQIEFSAGFDIAGQTGSGDDPALILPQQARLAILMLTEHWYNNRSAVDGVDLKNVPMAAEALMAQVRVYR